jgi:hypothetical protein
MIRLVAMTRVDVTAQEFRELFDAVSNWARWANHRGALNHLTPDRIAAAAGLVRSGTTVTLAKPLPTEPRIDVPEPADHHMTMLPDDAGSGGLQFAKDYIGGDYHNDGYSHFDAFCHVAFEGLLFDGAPGELDHRRWRTGGDDRSAQGRARRPRSPARRAARATCALGASGRAYLS